MISSLDSITQREALEELLMCPGWRVFAVHMLNEYEGRGYQAKMKAALNSTDPLAPKVVDRTADEVVRLLRWPEQRVAALKGVPE